MKEVSKEIFEKIIYRLDVCYSPVGEKHPYGEKFTFRNGDIVGTKNIGEGYMISDNLYEKYCLNQS